MVKIWRKVCDHFIHGKGLLLSLLAAIGLTVSPVLSRRAADVGVPGLQLVLVNELCNLALFVPLALFFRVPFRGKDWKQTVLMLSNGALRVVGTTSVVVSVLLIPPGNSFAIGQGAAAPIFSMVLAYLIMREAPGWPNVIGIVFQIAGVVMVVFGGKATLDSSSEHSDPPPCSATNNTCVLSFGNATGYNVTGAINNTATDEESFAKLIPDAYAAYVVGNILAILGPSLLALVDVINRRSMKDNAKLTTLVLVETWGTVLILPLMYLLSTPKWNLELELVFSIIGQGVIWTLSVGCLYNGLNSEKAATVYIMLGLSTVLGYILQYFVVNITPRPLELIGAAVIVLTVVVVVGLTWRQNAKNGMEEAKEGEENVKVRDKLIGDGGDSICKETSV
ncbi:solute carrier family 35 member G2-like [Branchiostoma lanceolatum]|uniref:solute carrier family 35 member G2-like n=1 Tax=Branchiostoma lanceolatum TaxID=7740 RepID=UPI003451D8CC